MKIMPRIMLHLLIFFLTGQTRCFSQDHHLHVLENERLRVEVNPQGAELQRIVDKKNNSEILWIGDSSYWQAQAPVMFPVNVRFKDEKYTYQGREYIMPRMGLAVLNTFSVQPESDLHKAVLTYNHSPKSREYYPFDFDFEITYELEEHQLINRFSLTNHGSDTMYFALGAIRVFIVRKTG